MIALIYISKCSEHVYLDSVSNHTLLSMSWKLLGCHYNITLIIIACCSLLYIILRTTCCSLYTENYVLFTIYWEHVLFTIYWELRIVHYILRTKCCSLYTENTCCSLYAEDYVLFTIYTELYIYTIYLYIYMHTVHIPYVYIENYTFTAHKSRKHAVYRVYV